MARKVWQPSWGVGLRRHARLGITLRTHVPPGAQAKVHRWHGSHEPSPLDAQHRKSGAPRAHLQPSVELREEHGRRKITDKRLGA